MSASVIGKLLAKAERTDNPHEAEAFTRKAEALMVKLGIDEAVARQAAGGEVKPESIITTRVGFYVDHGPRTWEPASTTDTHVCTGCGIEQAATKYGTVKGGGRERECRACRKTRTASRARLNAESNAYNQTHVDGSYRVARVLGCDAHQSSGSNLHVFGFESDVARVVMLITSLKVQAMFAMWAWWTSEDRGLVLPDVATKARRDFVYSFWVTVAVRLTEDTKEQVAATPGAALALRNKAAEVQDHKDSLGLGEGGRGRGYGASAAGIAAGRNANLGGNAVGGGRKAIG